MSEIKKIKKKGLKYIKVKYSAKKVFYYGGVETDGFEYSVFDKKPINLDSLIKYLQRKGLEQKIKRAKFYRKLSEFGYVLKLKPVKIYHGSNGRIEKKANCDVDMTFDLTKYFDDYSGVLVLSGDGDFAVVLNYLRNEGKKVTVLARGERTAREIRQFAGKDFRDFNYLREILRFEN